MKSTDGSSQHDANHGDIHLLAEFLDFAILRKPEFERALEVPVRLAKGILPRLGKLLGCINNFNRSFLKNLIALHPAFLAMEIRFFAMSRLPLWLIPISPMM